MSLDLVERILVCSFESHRIPVENKESRKKRVSKYSLSDDDLEIKLLERREEMMPLFYTIPSSKKSSISQTLELRTPCRGDRLSFVPCPFYHFFLDLTDKEYRTCKALSGNTVFRASFSLKVGEPSEPESEEECELGAN